MLPCDLLSNTHLKSLLISIKDMEVELIKKGAVLP